MNTSFQQTARVAVMSMLLVAIMASTVPAALALDIWPFNKGGGDSAEPTSAEDIKNETLGTTDKEAKKRAEKEEKAKKRAEKMAASKAEKDRKAAEYKEKMAAKKTKERAEEKAKAAAKNGEAPPAETPPAEATSGPPAETPSQTVAPPATAGADGVQPRVFIKSPVSDQVDSLKVDEPVKDPGYSPEKDYQAIDDPSNPLGITTSAQKLDHSADLIDKQRYVEATKMLTPLKEWLVDATEVHINLYKTLKEIPSAQVQSELEKQLALQFAVLRDKAFFQLGLVAIGQKDYNLAIKHLSRVVQSQPRSPMGAKAYEVLQTIGFTERVQLRDGK